MLIKTHLSFSLLLALLFYDPLGWVFFVSVFVFTFLPDIETYKSHLGKRIKIISVPLKLIFGHRKMFHSFSFMLLFGLLYFIDVKVFLGAVVGYGSHLLLDMLNYSGIYVFWPFGLKIKGSFKAGGVFDYVLFVVFVSSSVILVISKW